jgi:hypothetical protein
MPELHEALGGLAVLVVGAVFAEVRSILKRRIERQELEDLMVALTDAVEDAVLAVGSTYLKGRKPASSGEAGEALGKAREAALEALGPVRAARLEKLLDGRLASVLSQKIEAALARRKDGGPVLLRGVK